MIEKEVILSVCIITKNEVLKLKRCIENLILYPFEIVVIDTGSEDDTVAMLLSLQKRCNRIKIGHFKWKDNFAEAKNYAVSQAECDMVMVLDSDEYVQTADVPELLRLTEIKKEGVGRIQLRNQIEQNGQILWSLERVSRVFSKSRYRYEGRIHEQLVRIDGKPYQTYEVPVTAEHDGYVGTPEERRAKAYRNIRLLEAELSEKEDPYLFYQLGKSYYMAGEYGMAADCFGKGLSFDLNPRLEYVIDMVETYGYALIHSGHAAEALQFENIYDEFSDTADFHILMGFIYMNNALFKEAVAEFERAAESGRARTEGADSYIAYYNAGVVEECLGHVESARHFYEKCGNYKPAQARLSEVEKTKDAGQNTGGGSVGGDSDTHTE